MLIMALILIIQFYRKRQRNLQAVARWILFVGCFNDVRHAGIDTKSNG